MKLRKMSVKMLWKLSEKFEKKKKKDFVDIPMSQWIIR